MMWRRFVSLAGAVALGCVTSSCGGEPPPASEAAASNADGRDAAPAPSLGTGAGGNTRAPHDADGAAAASAPSAEASARTDATSRPAVVNGDGGNGPLPGADLPWPSPPVSAGSDPSGIYMAQKIEGAPSPSGSGMVWWKGRLLIVDRGKKQIWEHVPPNTFNVVATGFMDPTGMGVDPQGNIIVAERGPDGPDMLCASSRITRLRPDGSRETVLPGPLCPQDLIVHKSGTIFWSTFPHGSVKMLPPGAPAATSLKPGVGHSFGLGLSPEQDYLYVASKYPDLTARGVFRFPLKPDGSPAGTGEQFIRTADLSTPEEKPIVHMVGRLQGLGVDLLGNLYIGGAEDHKDGAAIAIVSPDGKRVLGTIVNVAGDTINMHFGGADQRTLYITVAGSALRRVELPVAGGAAQ